MPGTTACGSKCDYKLLGMSYSYTTWILIILVVFGYIGYRR